MAFPENLRRELVSALSVHPIFSDPSQLRQHIRTALLDLKGGLTLSNSLKFSLSSTGNALEVVLRTRDVGRSTHNALGRILEALFMTSISERQAIVFWACFELLSYQGRQDVPSSPFTARRIPQPPRSPFVFVCSALEDKETAAVLVNRLRSCGLRVEWSLECPLEVDWQLWIVARFAGADRVMFWCSSTSYAYYKRLLTNPFMYPPCLRQCAQQLRLFSYEYFSRGAHRMIPVGLQGKDYSSYIPSFLKRSNSGLVHGDFSMLLNRLTASVIQPRPNVRVSSSYEMEAYIANGSW